MEKTFSALNRISYGLYIVSSKSDGKINGQLVNTVFQVSATPPQLAISLNKENLTHEYVKKSGNFSVSVLKRETPMTFIGLFGFKSGRNVNKFESTKHRNEEACPIVLENTLAYLKCKVNSKMDAKTHTVFLADVLGGEVIAEGEPLTYDYYREVQKGKTHKNATTFNKESAKPPGSAEGGEMKKYVCKVCGWVYDPRTGNPENNVPAGTPFEKISEGWVCPVCGAGKDEFEPEN